MADDFRGEFSLPSFSTAIGLAVPFAVSVLVVALLAYVHRLVVDPPEDSKRKRVPKRRHIVMAPTSWTDRRTLYSTPRAFECWLKMSRSSTGGVLVGSLGPTTTRAINVEIVDGKPHIIWKARDFLYTWTIESDLRTDEWVHLAITFAANSALDMLLCFVDGAEVEDVRPEDALPSVVPELPMLVGRDHSDDPKQSFDGEIALVRLWSCILPDDIIEAHVSGANRIYPALTENIKTVAAQEMAERRAEADGLSFHPKHLLHKFGQSWPEQASLLVAPTSIDFWVRMPEGAEGGLVASSAPAAGSIIVQIVRESGRARLTWYAPMRASAIEDGPAHFGSSAASSGLYTSASAGMGTTVFDLTLHGNLLRAQWMHVAFVYVAERDALVGYVDGVPAGEARRLFGAGNEPPPLPTGPLWYAQDAVAVGARGGGWFDGELAHVRFWASELRPAAIAAHAGGKAMLGAQLVSALDARVAGENREKRLEEEVRRIASASAEADADAARRDAEAADMRRRQDELLRTSKRQAADAQVKVASLMIGKRVRFSDAFAQPTAIEQGWEVNSAEFGAANFEVLSALAQLMVNYPAVRLEIHARVGSFGGGDLARSRPVGNAAKALGLDPKAPKAVVEEIGKRRAASTRAELIRLGMDEARLQLKWTALSSPSSTSDVLFTPKPMSDFD